IPETPVTPEPALAAAAQALATQALATPADQTRAAVLVAVEPVAVAVSRSRRADDPGWTTPHGSCDAYRSVRAASVYFEAGVTPDSPTDEFRQRGRIEADLVTARAYEVLGTKLGQRDADRFARYADGLRQLFVGHAQD